VILSIIATIGVNGATNMIIEFTGPLVNAMSMESRMTLCNMAVEAGATSGICLPDMTTVEYLWDFIKDEFKTREEALAEYSKWASDRDAKYEKEMRHDVSGLEPLVTVGYQPDQVKTVREMGGSRTCASPHACLGGKPSARMYGRSCPRRPRISTRRP
jgi:3-isopropylmalate/(R)-2-methylmalate dehydratase large subunit